MKNWLKENWVKVGLLVILIIAIVGTFYWLEWRPSQVRKSCANWALRQAKGKTILDFLSETYSQDQYDDFYTRCLRENGI